MFDTNAFPYRSTHIQIIKMFQLISIIIKEFIPLSNKYCTKINDFFRQTSNLMAYYIMQHMLNDFRLLHISFPLFLLIA